MKKLFATLVFSTVLAVASIASAAVQQFTTPVIKFSVDIPAGWSVAQTLDSGCILANDAKDTSVTIVVDKADGAPAKAFADAIAEKLQNSKVEADEDGDYTVTAEQNGVPVLCFVSVDKDSDAAISISVAGKDTDTASKIVDSLEEVQ